jgi:hypothetical protein
MDRTEALGIFVRVNLKFILSKEFPQVLFKRAKLDFFLEKRIGVPKDEEIAEHTIRYLIKIGTIADESKLSEMLDLPFFKMNIRSREALRELVKLSRSEITVVDPRKLSESLYQEQLKKELKQEIIKEQAQEIRKVVQEQTQEIQEIIDKKKEEYEMIPSVLDISDFEEPDIPEQQLESEERFVPWWKRLKLSGDPFPTQEGLASIADNLYERVVYKTSIFEKYVYLVREATEELFKDTIFFGEFGSGKTTLFDYLKKPFINEKVFPIYMQLYAEPSFQTLMDTFKRKLYAGLCEAHKMVYESDPREWPRPSDSQDAAKLLEKFVTNEDIRGFVVFIDDLHKNFDEFDIAMKFISNLQIFKAELLRQIRNIRIAFFIAGSADWENTIRNQLKFSGSYARHETMPPITEKAAYEMLDMRLSAFATNPETIRTIDLGFVKRIMHGLENSKSPITFRSFIRATLSEFDKGNFSILTVDPIHIPRETLSEVKLFLESNNILKKRINLLLFSGGIQKEENKKKCIDLLVATYLEQGIRENSRLLQDNKFGFQRLAKSGLIQKAKFPDGFKWAVCSELIEQNHIIYRKHGFSLEDYLLKIYTSPVPAKRVKIEKVNEELKIADSLIRTLRNREAKDLAQASRTRHSRIISEIDRFDRSEQTIESRNLPNVCVESLTLLTKSLSKFLGLRYGFKDDLSFLHEFWKEFWFSPGEIAEFIKRAYVSENKDNSERVWYVCAVYREAYATLLNFFANEVRESRIMTIVPFDLSNDEIKEFHKIRGLYGRYEYFEAAKLLTLLVQSKLRLFLFNVFTLLYGDHEARLRRVDATTKTYILDNVRKDQERDVHPTENEFEQVNRGNYKNFMIGSYRSEIGQRNWAEVFSQVFTSMTENEFRDFLSTFAEVDLATGHDKRSSFGPDQQMRVLGYILRSFNVVKKMNQAYIALLGKCLHIVDTGSAPRFCLLFSFNGLSDKDSLTPIFVKEANAVRIAERLLAEPKGCMSIDLENRRFVESYFSIDYREFMAIIARLVNQSPSEPQKTGLRVRITKSKGSIVTFGIERLSPCSTDLK